MSSQLIRIRSLVGEAPRDWTNNGSAPILVAGVPWQIDWDPLLAHIAYRLHRVTSLPAERVTVNTYHFADGPPQYLPTLTTTTQTVDISLAYRVFVRSIVTGTPRLQIYQGQLADANAPLLLDTTGTKLSLSGYSTFTVSGETRSYDLPNIPNTDGNRFSTPLDALSVAAAKTILRVDTSTKSIANEVPYALPTGEITGETDQSYTPQARISVTATNLRRGPAWMVLTMGSTVLHAGPCTIADRVPTTDPVGGAAGDDTYDDGTTTCGPDWP